MVEEIVGSVIQCVRTRPAEVIGIVDRVDQDEVLQVGEDFENGCQPPAAIQIWREKWLSSRIRVDGFDETVFEARCDQGIDVGS